MRVAVDVAGEGTDDHRSTPTVTYMFFVGDGLSVPPPNPPHKSVAVNVTVTMRADNIRPYVRRTCNS